MTVQISGDAGIDKVQQKVNGVIFKAVPTAATQSLTSNVRTKILFGTEQTDTDNAYDAGLSRFQPSVAGWYLINVNMVMGTNAAGSMGATYIRMNADITVAINHSSYTSNSATYYQAQSTSVLVEMNGTTDYIEVDATIVATNPFVTSSSYFSGCLVRAN